MHLILKRSTFQINMLLTFSMGEDCPCPADIQEELYDFHNQLQLHCGKMQRKKKSL